MRTLVYVYACVCISLHVWITIIVKITIVSCCPFECHLLSCCTARNVNLERQEHVITANHVKINSCYQTFFDNSNTHQQDDNCRKNIKGNRVIFISIAYRSESKINLNFFVCLTFNPIIFCVYYSRTFITFNYKKAVITNCQKLKKKKDSGVESRTNTSANN